LNSDSHAGVYEATTSTIGNCFYLCGFSIIPCFDSFEQFFFQERGVDVLGSRKNVEIDVFSVQFSTKCNIKKLSSILLNYVLLFCFKLLFL